MRGEEIMEGNNALDRVGSGKGEYIKMLEKYKSTHDSCVLLSINYDWFKYMQPFNISKSSCQSYEIIN